MRVLTEIPDKDVERLDALAKRQGKSRAAEIRDAVALYLAQNDNSNDWIQRWAGLWKDRDDIPDGLEYQLAIREDRTPYDEL